jgi:IclR family acetate operon transcriptional repressor
MGESSGSVKSVEKAFILLDCFLGKERRLSLKELSEMTGWPKSTVYNLLSAMRNQGIIVQSDEDGKYAMGIHMFQLGSAVEHTSKIIQIAKPYMEETADVVNKSVHLTALNYPRIVLISRSEPEKNPLKMIVSVGVSMPLYCTAPGKLFLAHLPTHMVQEYIQETVFTPHTSKTITDPEKLLKQLTMIREQGFAVEKSERNIGVCGVAAPILDGKGRIAYGFGVVGIFNDVQANEFRLATSAVVRTAYTISNRLGI